MNSASIIMLQEHWLSDGQLYLLGDISDSFLYSGVSGFDNSEVLLGRPYGGCAILWRSDLAVTVKVVNTESKRVCAIRMVNEQVKLLLVSVYMPYESDLVSTEEYTDQLMFVENILFNNSDCHVIIAGDFNVDFSRSWPHSVFSVIITDSLPRIDIVRTRLITCINLIWNAFVLWIIFFFLALFLRNLYLERVCFARY